jgi:hypothetical protein
MRVGGLFHEVLTLSPAWTGSAREGGVLARVPSQARWYTVHEASKRWNEMLRDHGGQGEGKCGGSGTSTWCRLRSRLREESVIRPLGSRAGVNGEWAPETD